MVYFGGGASSSGNNNFTGINHFSGGAGTVTIDTDSSINFGTTISSAFPALFWNSAETPDTLCLALGSTSNHVLIVERADAGFDFAHVAATDPTLFIHSRNQSTTQYLGLRHNGSDPEFFTGNSGRFTFNSGLVVNNDAGTAPTVVNTVASDGVQILSAATGRHSLYIHDTNSNSYNAVILDNNRGSLASYGLLGSMGSAFAGTAFGVNWADTTTILSAGASSAGMLLGTNTNQPLVVGTNDTERLRLTGAGSLSLQRTVTAAGTTGNQTINKMAGTVNFAAGASAITVTNSLVDASSIVFGVIRTADATATFIKSIVPGANTFTITLNATATAETSVGFWVTN